LATTPTRRPLPALIALAALLLLTALVWWRVLHRSDANGGATSCPTHAPPAATLPAAGNVTVTVLNATKRNGIASRARNRLVADGFNVPQAAANDRHGVHVRGVAEIRYGPKGKAGARLLRYYFPGAKLVLRQTKTATVVVSLGDKYRGVASASAVAAALKRDQIELSTATPGAPSPSATC
jgi:hypothetical protein